MTFVPINQHLWTKDNALVYGFANSYDKRKERDPDAMIVKIRGKYKCALGPDWSAPFVAETTDAKSAKYECTVAWKIREWGKLKEKRA